MANISAIKLPDGVTYDLVDRVSGSDIFVAHNGVTTCSEISAAITAGKSVCTTFTISEIEESVIYDHTYYVPLVLGEDDSYTFSAYTGTSHICITCISDNWTTETTPLNNHTHGNIQAYGTLQTSDISIANGDKLVVTDSSDSNKIARTSLAFDGSTTNKYLSKKGTFEDIPSSDIFVAAYGSTTYADISSAIDSGKSVWVNNMGGYLPLVYDGRNRQDGHIFCGVIGDMGSTNMLGYGCCASNNSWSMRAFTPQEVLTSGTNIKTIGSQSILGSGNVSLSQLGAQETLSSGYNIKTINNTSLLGSGNITVGGTQVQIVRW